MIRRFGFKFSQFQFPARIFLGTKINETTSVCNYKVSHSWNTLQSVQQQQQQQTSP